MGLIVSPPLPPPAPTGPALPPHAEDLWGFWDFFADTLWTGTYAGTLANIGDSVTRAEGFDGAGLPTPLVARSVLGPGTGPTRTSGGLTFGPSPELAGPGAITGPVSAYVRATIPMEYPDSTLVTCTERNTAPFPDVRLSITDNVMHGAAEGFYLDMPTPRAEGEDWGLAVYGAVWDATSGAIFVDSYAATGPFPWVAGGVTPCLQMDTAFPVHQVAIFRAAHDAATRADVIAWLHNLPTSS